MESHDFWSKLPSHPHFKDGKARSQAPFLELSEVSLIKNAQNLKLKLSAKTTV
jgi:hypothetical protein